MVAKSILILQEKPNPSTDYFVLSALARLGYDSSCFKFMNWAEPIHMQSEGFGETSLEGTAIIIVRYLTSDWQRAISKQRQHISQIIYFMDDDLLDWQASQGLSLRYRLKLWRHAYRFKSFLLSHTNEFWVSTSYLAQKYASYNALAIEPQQIAKPQTSCRIFYHATASHGAEINWLLPVMVEVLKKAPMVDFEIIGDELTWQQYRHLPRTTIVHPMSWQAYQHFIAQPGRDIGLGPFLPSPFNAARSWTKLFDIERAQAHGLLADQGPWVSYLHDHPDLTFHKKVRLIPMQQDAWVKALISWAHEIVG